MSGQNLEFYPKLLEAITTAQAQLLGVRKTEYLFDGLLSALLDLTESEYGFIGEVLYKASGEPYLKTHAITNIAWNEYTRAYFEENAPNGLEFENLQTLFGAVLTSQQPVIANAPSTDPRRGGLPDGHPPLDSFLGVPLHSAGRFVGMAGIANRSAGYPETLLQELRPFLQTCANAIYAIRADRERMQAQAQLANERQRLRAILDGAFEAIITIDDEGRIESCNRTAEDMFGYQQSYLQGKSIALLMPEEWAEEPANLLQDHRVDRAGANERAGREVMVTRRDGKKFPVQLTVNTVQVGDQKLFIGLIQDLSPLEEADRKLAELKDELQRSRSGQLVGRSPAMRVLYREIDDVSKGDWTVLIDGETGTGKELVARAIHAASDRHNGPFIAVNCAGLNDTLLSSQLFGHKRGAFTGAVRDQKGFFTAAEGGTLFLDEIGDISTDAQTSLLRALEDKEIIPLGDTSPHKVDVRIIAATNRDLTADVAAGRFREDLLYRLRVARLSIPPLRARSMDIELLAESFLAEIRVATGKSIRAISPSAISRLNQHNWPGNVRELRSAIEFAAIHCRTGTIGVLDLPPEIQSTAPAAINKGQLRGEFDEQEKIFEALRQTNGNRTQAAALLGISRATLYRKLGTAKQS
jgi:PAS domain S-box-containing protein